MTDTSPPLVPDDEQSRDRLRALLALCCVAAVVLAGSVVPAVSSGGLGDTPLGSIVPQPGIDPYDQDAPAGGDAGGGALAGGGGLGALDPGDRTSVGGSLAADDESDAFRSQNAEVHFTVRSSTASYWRTGAYDAYVGSGWERTEDREPYAGPLDADGMSDRRVEYRVRLNRSATALPTVWRPESVSGPDSLLVTDRRAFVADESLPAGTAYSGVSHLPPRDETVLQTAGAEYPEGIERRYADLPADTENRLGDFTANLTEDADTPYETAVLVEAWLEANKDYSLNVTPPEDDVASQFVFEMDEGYCEYFATAMTAMLRSQDVPARYVVGYSTGRQVERGTYEVRGMNAHAWVEVYFPDVGWVRFDPTPGSDRLQTERDAFENQTDDPEAEYEPVEEGSPGETFAANESDLDSPQDAPNGTETGDDPATDGPSDTTDPPSGTTDGDAPSGTTGDGTDSGTPPSRDPGDGFDGNGTDSDGGGPDSGEDAPDSDPDDSDESPLGGYDVELDRDPVPGATVTATVTRDGSPAVGVAVLFNGERVGTTDEDGTVTGEVPYARNLEITVREGSDAAASFGEPPSTSGAPAPAFGGFPLASDATASLAGPPARPLQAGNETNGSHSYPLETNATVAVSGDRVTGNEVVVTATVEDVPLRGADVRLDGERVAETDAKGRAEIRLPDSPGNATVGVSRGPVAGETTVSLPALNVSVEPSLPLALPGTDVEVSATYEGEPVPDARVAVGDAEATTDIDGAATAALPFRRSATVVVSVHGQTRREAVSGLLLNLFGVLAGTAAVVGGLGFVAYRRGATPRRIGRFLLAAVAAIPRLGVAAVFGVADAVERGIRKIVDALRELVDGEVTPRELVERLRAWLRGYLRDARARWSLDGLGGGPATEADAPRRAETDDSYRTLREAWRDFLLAVSVRRPDAMTPGELAAHAVREDGLPADAVATLRDAFRDVEYGARSPAERLPRVEDALAAIEEATRAPEVDPEPDGGERE